MNAQTRWVPFTFLNDPSHTAKTRLIWLLLGSHRTGKASSLTNRRMRELSGLDPKTVQLARAKYAQTQLEPWSTRPQPACAAMPMALLACLTRSPAS